MERAVRGKNPGTEAERRAGLARGSRGTRHTASRVSSALSSPRGPVQRLAELAPPAREMYERVIFRSNLAGIAEYGADFYATLESKARRMGRCRDLVVDVLALLGDDSGFGAFERTLVAGCARISGAYDAYSFAFMRAVQKDAVKEAIAADPPGEEFLNSYTILQRDATSSAMSTRDGVAPTRVVARRTRATRHTTRPGRAHDAPRATPDEVFVFGLGYLGRALAQALTKEGYVVRGTTLDDDGRR